MFQAFQNDEHSGDWFNDDSNLSMKSSDFNTLPLPDLSRSFDSMLDKSQSGIPGMLNNLKMQSKSGSIFSRDASSVSRKRRHDENEDSQPNKKMRKEDQKGPIGFKELLNSEKKKTPIISIQNTEQLLIQKTPPVSSPLFNHSVTSVPKLFDKSGSIEMQIDPQLNFLMHSAPVKEKISLPKHTSPFSLIPAKTNSIQTKSYAEILKENQQSRINQMEQKPFNFSLLHKTLSEQKKKTENQPSWCQIVLGSKNVPDSVSTSGTSASDSASAGLRSPFTEDLITTEETCLTEKTETPLDAQSTDKEMDTTSTSTGSAHGEKDDLEEKQREEIEELVTRPKIEPQPENSDEKKKQKRLQQINHGKNTKEYQNYIRLIPKYKRSLGDPKTPDHNDLSMSKRRFAGIMRAWRRDLHKWDEEEI